MRVSIIPRVYRGHTEGIPRGDWRKQGREMACQCQSNGPKGEGKKKKKREKGREVECTRKARGGREHLGAMDVPLFENFIFIETSTRVSNGSNGIH